MKPSQQQLALIKLGFASFLCYFSMYAFRKPFTAGTYDGLVLWGISYKFILVIAQVLGYMCSKFFGIKFIAELKPSQRIGLILLLIGIAELALLGLALMPFPWNFPFMILNGLPLGLIWGIVFSFLEGRKNTEILGSFLAISFIISSGVVKTVGRFLITNFHMTEFWMPFCTGLIFILPLLLSVWILQKSPVPTALDQELRSKRKPMTLQERKVLLQRFGFGLFILVIIYIFLNAYRDLRDNFMVEIWTDLGHQNSAALLSTTEIPIAIFVLLLAGLISFVKENFNAFLINHFLIAFSAILIISATFLFQLNVLPAYYWMTLTGAGMYLAYIIFQCMLFERFIASFKVPGNVGFLMYLADAFGYLGSVFIMLYKQFGPAAKSWSDFYIESSYSMGVIMLILIIGSGLYFIKKRNNNIKINNKQLEFSYE